jgi:hypothetical protein
MRRFRKIYLTLVVFIILIVVFGFYNMLNKGYIPFTEEYDLRMYRRNYEESEVHFNRLIDEISVMNQNIPAELYVSHKKIRYELNDGEWKIIIFNDNYERIYEANKPVENAISVVEIEKVFDASLFGITYEVDDGGYIFNIGEYYRIYINGDNIAVK